MPPRYQLFGVLVHRGEVARGHYYAFFKLPGQGQGQGPAARWYRFDDSRVSVVPESEAVEDNFGGAQETVVNGRKVLQQKSANACAPSPRRASPSPG